MTNGISGVLLWHVCHDRARVPQKFLYGRRFLILCPLDPSENVVLYEVFGVNSFLAARGRGLIDTLRVRPYNAAS